MDFVKMEGLGNDFVIIAGPAKVSAEQVGRWCDRRRGVGADGVLVVSPLDDGGVSMHYWNADGGEAEMCGNGLRCVARFAYDREWTDGREFVVSTAAGDLPVRILRNGVRAFLGRPVPGVAPSMDIEGLHVLPLDMGNPHAVVLVEDTAAAPVGSLGPIVEHDEAFPDRTNVEFVAVKGRHTIQVRTWERGVGETLACGTGAAAAAVIAHREGLIDANTTVELLGGELHIEVGDAGVWSEGPANYVFEGTIPD